MHGGSGYARNWELPPLAGWHRRRWYRMLELGAGLGAALADALRDSRFLHDGLRSGNMIEDSFMLGQFERHLPLARGRPI